MGKKNPFIFTIGFDKSDPDHVYVTELLNTTDVIDKGNAELTFEARKPYFDEYQVMVKERSAMAYLYTKNTLTVHNKRITGINAENFDSLNWSTWNWDVQ